MRRTLSILFAVLPMAACSVAVAPRYDAPLALRAVQRPQDVAQRWGEYTLTPADSSGYTYEDGLVSLAVVPDDNSFSVLIRNKTEHTIRLLWAEGSYVGPDGIASGIVPGETSLLTLNNAPAAQTIPTRASVAVLAIPRSNVNTSTAPNAQRLLPFFPAQMTCARAKDATLRLILPLEIQGTTNEYTLEFAPREVAIVTEKMEVMMGTKTVVSRRVC